MVGYDGGLRWVSGLRLWVTIVGYGFRRRSGDGFRLRFQLRMWATIVGYGCWLQLCLGVMGYGLGYDGGLRWVSGLRLWVTMG